MIENILLLLACQLVGEIANRVGLLILPGPVTGLALLFLILCWRGRRQTPGTPVIPHDLAGIADMLLRNLSILYVPASVGIIDRLDILRAHPLAIAVSVLVSTIVTQAVTALVFEQVLRRRSAARLTASGQIR